MRRDPSAFEIPTRWRIVRRSSASAVARPPLPQTRVTSRGGGRWRFREHGRETAQDREARLLQQPLARHRADRPAAPADLHLLLLADRRGALLGLHARAPLGRRQRMGRLRQLHRHARRPGLLELDRQQHHLRRREHRPRHGDRAGAGAPHRPRAARGSRSTARCWSGPSPSPRRRSAWPSASSWRPRPGSSPSSTTSGRACGIRRLNGTDAMIGIVIAFAWKYIGYNFIFFLAALQAIPRSLIEAGGHGRRRAHPPHARHPAAAADADALLPARHQPHRQLHRQLRHRRHHDPGRAGRAPPT